MAVDGKVKVVERNSGNGVSKFFREVKAEFKRITWPTKKDVKKASVAVGVLCLMYIVYVGVLDYAFQNLFKLVFNVK